MTMKCPSGYEEARAPCGNMEKDLSAAATAAKQILNTTEASPLKEHIPAKAQFTSMDVTTELFSLNKGPVDDKENNNGHNKGEPLNPGEVLQDSGYLSNSRNDVEHGSEEEHSTPMKLCRLKSRAPASRSPSNCQAAVAHSGTVWTSSPKICRWKKRSQNAVVSTPLSHSDHHNLLPIVKFQLAVCEELGKSFQKSRGYDWSVVGKVAEDHLLDRVIGGHMGREYVDVFSSLLSRNMRATLTNLLAFLRDMDLISCSQVSRSWRKIINEDTAALNRCQQAQALLKESRNSSGQENWCILTRDVTLSRVVLSSMQSLASSTPSSSATPNYRAGRPGPSSSSTPATPNYWAGRPASSSTPATPNYWAGRPAPSSSSTPATPNYWAGRPASSSSTSANYRAGRPAPSSAQKSDSRVGEYMQAASDLKQHESLRSCIRCGSPAKHLVEAQRATCTRASCGFEFCTCCHETFHGSTPCRTVTPHIARHSKTSASILPGSARSKRNVRRL